MIFLCVSTKLALHIYPLNDTLSEEIAHSTVCIHLSEEYYPEIKHFRQFGFRQLSAISAEYRNCRRFDIFGHFGRSAEDMGNADNTETPYSGNFGHLLKSPNYHLSAYSGISAVSADSAENTGMCRKCRIYRKFSDFGYVCQWVCLPVLSWL